MNDYSFWDKELKSISSLINGICPDNTICITGVPSYERCSAVETILKEKEIEYLLYSCNSRSSLRDILSELCKYVAKLIDVPFTMKSCGELVMDIKEYCSVYAEKYSNAKSVYLLLDSSEKLDKVAYKLVTKLSTKISHLGVIVLCVNLDPFILNSSYVVHLPVLTDSEVEIVLNRDLGSDLPDLTKDIIHQIVVCFSSLTHSLSELRTLRDLAVAYCKDNCITSNNITNCIKVLKDNLFVNIMPIYSDKMESISLTVIKSIPLSDFCGVDISLNAKLLLIASYLCSIYPESEDCRLFGTDSEQTVKTKGRKRRRASSVVKTAKSSFFTVHRLLALYRCLKQSLFPDMQYTSANYGLLLSQISALIRLGLLSQVGSNTHVVELNQLLYRCSVKRINVLNIAKNINFDIYPFL